MDSTKFGYSGKLIAHPGQRDALAAMLLESAAELGSFEGCLLYVISVPEEDPDSIWITEVWTDAAAHAASLQLESVKATIARARPMIAGMEGTKLRTLGGKGL
ncbi:putative quinol monooxygenase [Paenibacillus sp. HJGM_3]|uniref:putative quinol monooxygenase n=1 Tax=Paenibacillus sp. HJGM_3 TaxID=3379816 RepID=UPI00385CD9D4